ncbi:MAG: AI-2E family transporter [Cereibacter sphaeroides]|uniref:AI-2E family transporter n=1 Tax=Cereibacter sphaeroides TaxID=1063 RepID=A0A2W5SFJ9_CERSP|nr:MAG: AI-2E family transporter [Cereibacter sphaeroides]
MGGWLLIVGQAILLPIFMAIIAVYVLTTAADVLGRLPLLDRVPPMVRHGLVLMAFTAAIIGFALVVAVTVNQLFAAMPRYQANLEALLLRLEGVGWIKTNPTWDDIREVTLERINLQRMFVWLLGSLTSFGLSFFLVAVYAAFLLAERTNFKAKLAAALPDSSHAEMTSRIVNEINRRIGDYLAVKTAINVILGIVSFAILWAMDVDFALFWAVLIGLFNYIPYLGGVIGVAFPVVLSLAQFGSPWTTLILAALLTAAQVYIGTVLDPRLVGKQVNLSPFVVLIALSVWSALWGLPGAILAVPLTSMIAIICGAFEPTRFIAVLLSESYNTEDEPGPA